MLQLHSFILSLAAAVVFTLAAGPAAHAQPRPEAWPIPDPATATHPGTEAAPASSPVTYPDEEGFDRRAMVVLRGVAEGDLEKWRQGYFKGGDPGKYLPGHAMAKLLLDPENEEVRKYMNDDRSYKDHYHFGTVNWARYYPIFEKTLTDDTKQKFADYGFRYGSYAQPKGTENHRVMWWTSALVLPQYTDRGLTRRSPEQTMQHAKGQLREYVKGLYQAGQGEWDSSTYLMFDLNGLMNIYDFSDDEESRLLAKAALDLLVSGYALKYRNGIYTGPHQRGAPAPPHSTIADETGYVWFGSDATVTPEDTRGWRYTLHAITSSYRPNAAIYNIAKKDLPNLPVELRNTKADYWHGHEKQPEPHMYHETLYVAPSYTMGTLWDLHGGQATAFQIVADGADGGVSFTGGHPRKSDHTGKKMGIGFSDGTGRYDTRVAVGPTAILVADLPPKEEEDIRWSFFTLPEEAGEPVRKGEWLGVQVGKTLIAVRSVAGEMEIGETEATQKQPAQRIVMFHEGEGDAAGFSGFVVETAEAKEHASVTAFLESLSGKDFALDADGKLKMQDQQSRYVVVMPVQRDDPGRTPFPIVRVFPDRNEEQGGDVYTRDSWPGVYSGPFVKLQDSVLTINDGKQGFVVDFTGDMPVYGPLPAVPR